MNYKGKMMLKYKTLYGGDYHKENGKWYWKKTPQESGILVTSGWIIDRIKRYKPEQLPTIEIQTPVETPLTVPAKPVKKSTPKKKKEVVVKEELKTQTEQQ